MIKAICLNEKISKNMKLLKIILFLIFILPLIQMIYHIVKNDLSNPIEYLIRYSGDKAILFLTLTLSITPLRKILSLTSLLKLRRFLGLWTFFYFFVHLNIWFLDNGYSFDEMRKNIMKPYIVIGLIAGFILFLLAITSFKWMIRKMAKINSHFWMRLHQMVYVSAILSIIHYYLIKVSKNDLQQVYIYASILFFLLIYRFLVTWKNSKN